MANVGLELDVVDDAIVRSRSFDLFNTLDGVEQQMLELNLLSLSFVEVFVVEPMFFAVVEVVSRDDGSLFNEIQLVDDFRSFRMPLLLYVPPEQDGRYVDNGTIEPKRVVRLVSDDAFAISSRAAVYCKSFYE